MSKQVKVGNIFIGGGAPVSIQSMTNTDTRDAAATLKQVEELASAGCQIVRCAIPDMDAVKGFEQVKLNSPLPLVADIHFDYRLALAAIDAGADKIRINPGNIGSEERVRLVLEKAKANNIPIRIGVNSGSLEKELIEKYHGVTAEGLCESALKAVSYAESFGFEDIVVSLKSSDVAMNYKAHKLFRAASDRPLHVGLTEAGIGETAEIKSAIGIGSLLMDGIGDTMRVSLTGDPVREVILAKKILSACGLRKTGIDFISCPTCGRTEVDLPKIAFAIENALKEKAVEFEKQSRFIKVAVMGCAVNGPGEAKSADYGVACGPGIGLLIKHGEIVKKVNEDAIVAELLALIDEAKE